MKRRTGQVARGLAPLGGGVLVALSLPPFGLWPMALFGVAVLAWAVRDRSVGGRAAAGFLAGVGQFAIGLAWADKFTLLGYGGLIILHSAMFAVACALVPRGPVRVPALAAALTLAEWVRERWPFGGVPPGGIALGQASSPLVGTARIGGTVLLVGVTYLCGASLGDLAVTWLRGRRMQSRAHSPGLIGCWASLAVVVALCHLGHFCARWWTSGTHVSRSHCARGRPARPVRSAGPGLGRVRGCTTGDHDGPAAGRSRALARGRRGARPAVQRLAGSRAALRDRPGSSHDARRRHHRARGHHSIPKRDRRLLPLRCAGRRFREGSPGPFRRVRPMAVASSPTWRISRRSPATPSGDTAAD